MNPVGQIERITQQQVIDYFTTALGYRYLGHWKDRIGNSHIEEELLTQWLTKQGHTHATIQRALDKLQKECIFSGNQKSLYDVNHAVYGLLRYGVKVQPAMGEQNITVWLIDWKHIENNDFAIAEEVTIQANHTKRPDIVLYINGIAIGVLELKRSTVSVTEGIRQNLGNQKKDFIQSFFTTIQLIMAGNSTEGLRYGVIQTPEKYYLHWKEPSSCPIAGEQPLLQHLHQICRKDRLLEIIHDFIVYDQGTKKICRHNQYFGVKAAQHRVRNREGGIIWHTQGSGKSLTMVWLAKWIRENVHHARVLVITDRTELDEQIEKVFIGVEEHIHRTQSGADLIRVLQEGEKWLVCSLIHKFGRTEELSDKEITQYIEEIRSNLPKDFRIPGELFVFIDECHRTQSGALHHAMKTILNNPMFIGFSGTPLLKKDKQTSIEVFGSYIHTYKYDQAVRDGVVLDLRYEARDIDQSLTSQEKIDQWFEMKTKDLSDLGKSQLKQRWGTMQKVLSSQDRLSKIVGDILLDMGKEDRLASGRGNALLVSDSILSACRFFEMFQKTDLKDKCAIITSYRPNPGDIRMEETGEGLTERLLRYDIYRKMLADYFNEPEERAMYKVEIFEKEIKQKFITDPGQMKLLIVVDKLLTGFDAPSATFLYIDKHMQDHGLFQAICRVNRLDGEDKEYGRIIDYKDLFRSLEQSIKDYTGEALGGFDKEDVAGLLKDRLVMGKERLDEVREQVKALCEGVEPPRDTAAYIRYFCQGQTQDPEILKDKERKRVMLYKLVAAFLRAYANLANEMVQAGYTETEARRIHDEVAYYENVRKEVKLASADYVDMKVYEPAMRHLLDTYIRADHPEVLSTFDDMGLVELLVDRGEEAVKALPEGIQNSQEATGEAIENNIRKLIIDEMAVNPKYYEQMSMLLNALILERRKQSMDYREYLARVVELAKKVKQPETQGRYPSRINSPARMALYDNLDSHEEMMVREETALLLDQKIRNVKRDNWRGNKFKEREVKKGIRDILREQDDKIDKIFEIVKNQREY